MILNNIKNNKDRGFTIVELLIVIVIIGILAAITIVSYTGITQRANGAKALSNAQAIQSAAEAYNADNSNVYPMTTTQFANATLAKLPTGLTLVKAAEAAPTAATGTTYFQLFTDTTTGGSPVGNQGGRIVFWDYAKANLCTSVSGNANSSTTDSCLYWGPAKSSDTFVVFAS